MKYLQKFNERKFFTVKYNEHELSVDDIQNGEWSITDHLNPKIDSLCNALNDIKNRVNTKGAKVYSDEADKIDQMYKILTTEIVEPVVAEQPTIEEPVMEPVAEPVSIPDMEVVVQTTERLTYLKPFNEYNTYNDPKDNFDKLCDILDMIEFDDQSHPDNNIEKVSVYQELLRRDGITRLEKTFSKIMTNDRYLEMPYTAVIRKAVDDLFYDIDLAIGTSSGQEEQLRISLMQFMNLCIASPKGKPCEHCGTENTKHTIGCSNGNQFD